MGYSFRLAARVLLYVPSHRQDSSYHGLCYTVVEHWLEREIAQWDDDDDAVYKKPFFNPDVMNNILINT